MDSTHPDVPDKNGAGQSDDFLHQGKMERTQGKRSHHHSEASVVAGGPAPTPTGFITSESHGTNRLEQTPDELPS